MSLYEPKGVPGAFPSEDAPRLRAADDYWAINQRVRQLEARRRVSSEAVGASPPYREITGTNDASGFDVVCNQPVPEDYGVSDGGGGRVEIRRRDGGHHG